MPNLLVFCLLSLRSKSRAMKLSQVPDNNSRFDDITKEWNRRKGRSTLWIIARINPMKKKLIFFYGKIQNTVSVLDPLKQGHVSFTERFNPKTSFERLSKYAEK